MTIVNLKGATPKEIQRLFSAIELLEEQQGNNSWGKALFNEPAQGNKGGYSKKVVSSVSAADILAHFNYTGEAKIAITHAVVDVTYNPIARFRLPDPRDLEPLYYAEPS